jgi:hypothetical protein
MIGVGTTAITIAATGVATTVTGMMIDQRWTGRF